MKLSALAALIAGTILVSSGLHAAGVRGTKKKKPQPDAGTPSSVAAPDSKSAKPIPQMTADQKVLHALNRLTFGARPGDFEQVKQTGISKWIDLQLHPDLIPENPLLDAKLQPLDTLRMGSAEMAAKYPSDQMVRQMVEGRQPVPTDPTIKYMIERAVTRYQKKLADDAAGKVQDKETPNVLHVALDPSQKQLLENGKPVDQAKMVAALPDAEQWDVLDSMPQGARQRMYNAAPPELRRKIQMFNGPQQVVNQDLIEGKLFRAIYSNRQTEEVLTDFWYNHFNVFLDKGADRYMVTTYERDVIRPHVLGHFKDLLLATAESPAMLFYLDNWQSVGPNSNMPVRGKRRNGLNENYGRELMELHTLGVDGGYTQQDVTEVARCFTGWTIREPNRGGGFEFNARMHDNGEKHVLGVTIPAGGGMEDGIKVLDILTHHPSTARFVSRKLAIRFVSDNPSDALVQRMAATFTATDGDLREVVKTMLNSEEFWAASNFRSKVKSPLEMLTSAIRAVNGDVDYAFTVAGQLNQLGEPLFRKAEPTGYSNRSGEWMNSAALLARMNFAIALAQNRVPGVKVDTSQFKGETAEIERAILSVDASAEAKAAIEAAMQQRLEAQSYPAKNADAGQSKVGQPQPSVGQPQPSVGQPQPSVGQPQPSVGQMMRAEVKNGQRAGFQLPSRAANQPIEPGALVAGLTLGSPDFQRR